MKLKTAVNIISIVVLNLFVGGVVFAQTPFEAGGGDVDINANINQDLYSQLSISPTTVELREPATVSIQLLLADNSPKPGRSVEIYVNGSSTGVSITQPGVTDSDGRTSGSIYSTVAGTYEVCAMDTTDTIDIYILDCETLYVVPVSAPVLLSEPQYTQGNSNTLSWNMSGSGSYTYLIQSAKDVGFTNGVVDSGWIAPRSYQFSNLVDSQIYFYRVKAKNSYGAESVWSNSVYSVQDSSAPAISLLSVSGLGTNNTQTWEAQDLITIKLRVKDNTGILSKSFWCVGRDNSAIDCLNTEITDGDIWTITVKLGDLEHDESYHLYGSYSFCAEASDTVGNTNRFCNISLTIPAPSTEEPETPVTPIIEQIKDTVNEIIENSKQVIQNTIGRINQSSLQQISILVGLGNLLVGLGILIGGIGTVPYVLIQLFLAFSSLLGFRKKGNPAGYVYDSVTKEPIPQCIVRVFNENNELVWTDVTDRNGYFKSVTLKAGEYSIAVSAQHYSFPSKLIFGKTDFPLENVYHGQEFYSSRGVIPNFSIPMDRREMSDVSYVFNQFRFASKALWKSLHILLFVVGLIFSIYALSTNQIWYNYLIVGLYIPSIFLLFFSLFGRGERYGVVKDVNGKRLSGVILGLKEKEFDKLISKRVTDDYGKYRFFIYPGKYDLAVLSSDWKLVDGQSLSDIVVKKASVLARKVVVEKFVPEEKRVKKVKPQEVLEPLGEL